MPVTTKAPWHLWLVGGIGLLLNVGSAFDYVMTQTKNDAYMAEFTPEQLTYFHGFPAWVDGLWAIAVWTGVLGAVFLLARWKSAAPVLWASFVSTIGLALYMFVLGEVSVSDLMGPAAFYFSLVIILVAGLLAWYAQAMVTRDVLR